MKSFRLPVLAATMTIALSAPCLAQNQYRMIGIASSQPAPAKPQRPASPGPRLASQITSGEVASEEIATGGFVANGYEPEAGAGGVSAGCAYGTYGQLIRMGFVPDYGIAPGGMSVWPGVPACCDPWLGYCGEPRCNACGCNQGTFMAYHCKHGGCGKELLVWQRGGNCDKCATCNGNCGQPAAMSYGAQGVTAAPGCAKCRGASYTPTSYRGAASGNSDSCGGQESSQPSSLSVITPERVKVPPRNTLPQN